MNDAMLEWSRFHNLFYMEIVIPSMGLEKGQIWYIKLPGDREVSTVKLIDVTCKTVQIQHAPYDYTCRFQRYQVSDIELIERVK